MARTPDPALAHRVGRRVMTGDSVGDQPVTFKAWPPLMRPELSDVYAHNELVSPIPPDRLWAWLVRARGWSQWYANCRRLRILGGGSELELGTSFRWSTFGTTITSTVDVFDSPKALGWTWYGSTASGYHIWLLHDREQGGTRIVTEESQRGLGPHYAPWLFRRLLLASHGMWLRDLSARGQRRPRDLG